MKVKVESEKVGLKLNIQKTKIMESGPITSWHPGDSEGQGSLESCSPWDFPGKNTGVGCHFLLHGGKEYNQSDLGVDHLVMSMCRVFSCVVGRVCLL